MENAAKIDNKIYLRNGHKSNLRVFDIKNEKFKKSITHNPYKLINNEKKLIVQSIRNIKYQNSHPSNSISDIYALGGRNYKKLASMPERFNILCADNKFIYVISRGKNNHQYAPFRINITSSEIIENHFNDCDDIFVFDIWQEKEKIWYLCLSSLAYNPHFGIGGKTTLISKCNKKTNAYSFGNEIHYGVGLIGGDDGIWVFSSPTHRNSTIEKYKIGFLKRNTNNFIYSYIGQNMFVFRKLNNFDRNEFLWVLIRDIKGSGVVKINQIVNSNFEATQYTIHAPCKSNNKAFIWDWNESNIYADDSSLWLMPYVSDRYNKFRRDSKSYLLKVDKSSKAYETYLFSFRADFLKPLSKIPILQNRLSDLESEI
jgi:hypothetical protein